MLYSRVLLLLVGTAFGLRLPSTSHLQAVQAAPTCSRHASLAMLAKKKKAKGNSKVSKAADKALAALEALESGDFDDNGLGAAVPEPPAKKKKKDKKAAAAADEVDPFDIPIPDGMAVAVPEQLKKKNKKGAAAAEPEPAAAAPPPPAAPAGLTMAEKVAKISAELGVDGSLPLAKAVAAANEAMGLEGSGTMIEQVAELMAQLGISDAAEAPAAAAAPAAPAAPAPAPVAPPPAPEPEPVVEEVVAEVAAVEEEAEAVEVAAEVVEEEVEKEVKLSKKKMGKKKKEKAEGDDAEAEGDGEGTDQSGRRMMGTKRIETFADAPPGFAYVKLQDGKLRFRQQEVLKGVTWDAQTGQRVGLVGNNGAGKTTQLRVLAEELELDEGSLIKSSSDIKISFLRQEFREELREERTLKEEFLATFEKVQQLEDEYKRCEEALANAGEGEQRHSTRETCAYSHA